MEQPSWLFNRETIWRSLVDFVGRGRPGLAIVRGRRRHGKSAVLRALAASGGLFYYQAIQGVEAEQRRDLARAFAQHTGGPEPAFATWADAIDALLHHLGERRPVIIDELPYLTDSTAGLESVLQRALDTAQPDAAPLIACGSALTVMTRLLVGSAPLRGRAQLELDIGPFDYRTAAAFWGVGPEVALGVSSVIGGVPGYATDLLDRTFPAAPSDVERWLVEVAASVRRPLVHEARAMLDLEPGVRDPSTYLSVLGTVASGATRAGEIAGRIGRSTDAVSHALTALASLGLVLRRTDLLSRARPTWAIADPLLRFYVAVLRPNWELVERGDPARLTNRMLEPWRAQVLGPHLEELLREWMSVHADSETLGGDAVRVGWGTVNDPGRQVRHELDMVAVDARGRVLAIGEAKLRRVTGEDRARLAHIGNLVTRDQPVRILLCSASGFTPDARGPGVELIDMDRLYHGS